MKENKDNQKRVYYDERVIYEYFRYPVIVGILAILWYWLISGESFKEALISGAIVFFLALLSVVAIFIGERLSIK